jgi:3-phenylpropionate/trans-cinnamate dioxygenase ferredoxin reductase subunit
MSSESPSTSGPDLTLGVPATDLAEGDLLLGHVGDEPVLLTRDRGEVLAVGARCTHYGGPLHEGLVVDGAIRCPWHHAAFDLRTGQVRRPPALDGITCWQVVEREGRITVSAPREVSVRPPAVRASRPDSVLILGGGAAGHQAAETLRRDGYDGTVTIIEAGPDAPYDRPNLSKDYLAGTAEEAWIPLRGDDFYPEHGIELVLGRRAVELDPAARRVRLDDGSERVFGALLIATGSQPVPLPGPAPAQRVYLLRSLADSRAIIEAAGRARRAVVIGASFIGLEVAASLRARGLDVTVVAPDAQPLEKALGPELGAMIRALHEEKGVSFRLGHHVKSVGVTEVILDAGESLPADLVVAGIGVRPVTDLAERAGLTGDRGIVVDRFLETSAPGIYAAGDVARWPDPRSGELIRVEHWVFAQRQGRAAAQNILAEPSQRRPFDVVPFFWSRHYDLSVDYTGYAPRWDRTVVRGDLAAHNATVAYEAGGRVLAAATVGRDRANLALEAALERGTLHDI